MRATQSGVVIALGELSAIEGYGMAGAQIVAAETDDAVLDRWTTVTRDAGVVILTARAAAVLGDRLNEPSGPMTVVLPQ